MTFLLHRHFPASLAHHPDLDRLYPPISCHSWTSQFRRIEYGRWTGSAASITDTNGNPQTVQPTDNPMIYIEGPPADTAGILLGDGPGPVYVQGAQILDLIPGQSVGGPLIYAVMDWPTFYDAQTVFRYVFQRTISNVSGVDVIATTQYLVTAFGGYHILMASDLLGAPITLVDGVPTVVQYIVQSGQ